MWPLNENEFDSSALNPVSKHLTGAVVEIRAKREKIMDLDGGWWMVDINMTGVG